MLKMAFLGGTFEHRTMLISKLLMLKIGGAHFRNMRRRGLWD